MYSEEEYYSQAFSENTRPKESQIGISFTDLGSNEEYSDDYFEQAKLQTDNIYESEANENNAGPLNNIYENDHSYLNVKYRTKNDIFAKKKYILYVLLLLMCTCSLTIMTKINPLDKIMHKIKGISCPYSDESMLRRLGMIEGRQELINIARNEQSRFKFTVREKKKLYPYYSKVDESIYVEKMFNVWKMPFAPMENTEIHVLEDAETKKKYIQVAVDESAKEFGILNGSKDVYDRFAKKGESESDFVDRTGLSIELYRTVHEKQKGTEDKLNYICEQVSQFGRHPISKMSFSAKRYIWRQALLILENVHKNGGFNAKITENSLYFNDLGAIRFFDLRNIKYFDINSEGLNNSKKYSQEDIINIGRFIIGTFPGDSNNLNDKNNIANRWHELAERCVNASGDSQINISELISEYSDIIYG